MKASPRSKTALAAALAVALASPLATSAVRGAQPPDWRTVKCARYKEAWTAALARFGRQGLGQEFLSRHDAFLASGCAARADVCPRSPEEFKLANAMVILAMNAGTASTFPPFACRQ